MQHGTRFLSCFMLALLMQYGCQFAWASEQEPIAFLSERSLGAIDLKKTQDFIVSSPTGYLELILSPVERLTFIDGALFSYVFFQNSEYPTARACLAGSGKLGFGIEDWHIIGTAWLSKHGSPSQGRIVSLDGKQARISYSKNDQKWTITLF